MSLSAASPALTTPLRQQHEPRRPADACAVSSRLDFSCSSSCSCRSPHCFEEGRPRTATAISSGWPISSAFSASPSLTGSDRQLAVHRHVPPPSCRFSLAFLFAYGLTRTCMPGTRNPVTAHRADTAAGALAPAGHQPRLPVRQPGPRQRRAARRIDIRADRHRHRRGVLDLSACPDHHHDRTRDLRRAALRGRAGASRQAVRASSGR